MRAVASGMLGGRFVFLLNPRVLGARLQRCCNLTSLRTVSGCARQGDRRDELGRCDGAAPPPCSLELSLDHVSRLWSACTRLGIARSSSSARSTIDLTRSFGMVRAYEPT
jgi:hypothetical protein